MIVLCIGISLQMKEKVQDQIKYPSWIWWKKKIMWDRLLFQIKIHKCLDPEKVLMEPIIKEENQANL